ncbi:phage tail spike protein [Clostridium perfringens]|uniref:phage tail spike protein n=1 Tax=Clostridium perfringens TaxID=1502 RepID=UPI002447423B|nr:phage tail spike protein [Clostridium perfringens]MDH2459524.1 phage tail spike protein [Clostridium perfringens]MDU2470862.1 phage tail spike protein [Clostridium perfringens]
MLQLHDKNKRKIAGLVNYENLCIESVLLSGDKTLSFSYNKNSKYYDEIVEEAYIRTKKDEFVIKARDINGDYTRFDCVLNLEELEANVFDRFESVEQLITASLNLAIVGTGWTVKDNTLKKKRTVRCTNKNTLEIVQEIKKTYRVDIVFNTLEKQIEVYEHLGEDRGTYFIDSLNLTTLQVQSDSYKFATRIIAEGKDKLTFADINDGKNYVENFQYSKKIKTIYWKDERYTIKENLLEDAKAKLKEISKPFTSYNASILNLAELNPKYKNILDYQLGDTITLLSKNSKLRDKQRIVKTIEWPQDHTKDSVELANATLKFEDIQQENQETTSIVNNITTDNGTVDGSTIDSITTKQIEDFEANVIKVAKLKAILAEIENLHVNKADIQNLNAVIARIGTLEVTKASITELNAIHAIIQQIKAGKADIADLNVAVAKVGILENKTSVLENALAGNLTADNFKTNAITAGSAVIAEGAIGSSQISSLSVNKLEAGDITTSKHRIVSADGTIEIVGNQILINRNNVNRVILGEYRKIDGTTDYGLLIRGKDGKTIMLDSDGVHNAGITNGAIDNNKVADNANISGNKLDINSVIREVNNNGIETIKGTKVTVGDRTLDVELSTQNNTITEHSKELSSQKASLTALDNALKFKVDSQTFTQSTTTINNNINRAKEEAINSANNAINNLQISFRNLAINSNFDFGWKNWGFNNPNNNATVQIIKDSVLGNCVKVTTQTSGQGVYSILKRKPKTTYSWSFMIKSDKTCKITVAHEYGEGTKEISLTTEWTKITGTGIWNGNGGALCFYSNVDNPQITYYLTSLIYVEGDKVGDWTPAPEDLKAYSDDVAKAKADLAQANAIANADGKITTEEQKRIQQAQENLNIAISKADKAKQDAILEANRIAELKKQEAINSSNSHADSKANEALNNAKAFVNSEITNVNTHLNKNTSEINILKGQIESKVSQSDIDKSIQNIKFNDVNMILNSGKFKDTDHWSCTNGSNNLTIENRILKFKFTNYASWGCYISNNSLLNKPLDISKKYTVVCKLKASKNQILTFNICDGNSYNYVFGKELSLTTEWQIFKFTFNPTQVGNERQFRFITSNLGYDFDLYIEFVKMVEGATSSDSWSMAPDYVLDNIKTVTDKISTVESKLTQENNSIKASVQDLNSTTQTITTNINNINRDLTSKISSNLDVAKSFATDIATNKANTAKQEAINSSNSHADSIAASKATEALNNAKTYINAEISTVNTKVNNVESNLNILSDRINSKVSQSDIDKAVTTIRTEKIIYARGTGNDFPSNALVKVNGKTITDGQGRGLRINALNKVTLERVFLQDYDTFGSEDAKVSFVNKINELNNGDYIIIITSQDASYPLHPPIKEALEKIGATLFDNKQGTYREAYALIGKSKLGRGNGVEMFIPRTANDKRFAEVSVKVGEDGTFIGVNPNNMGLEATLITSNISDVSSELTQTKNSIEASINSINSKTQSIETNLNGKATKQELTEVNNRVSTIKANLDSITQRVSNTESKTNSLETNINGKASKQELTVVNNKVTEVTASLNGITQRVGNTESRINALDGKVAGAVTLQQFTEFKQSNDKFKFTVEQRSSVSNILPNSSFHGGDRGWLHGGNEFWSGPYSGYGFKGRITGAIKNRAAYNNPERYLQTHKAYKVKKNTTYTINFHYICEKNVQSMDAFVVLSDTEHGDYAQPICVLTAQGGSQSNATEEKPFTYKFNTGNHEWVWIRFDHNGMKSGVNWDEFCWVYVSEIGIYEGDVGAIKWTPKGGEVYSANYQMDGLGFKGTFEDGTYASLGKDGLEWFNAGTGHAYHALTYVTSFDIPIGNPGKAYIKLPAEFTKRRNSLKWTVALRGYYYSTSGDFFPFHIHCTGGRDYIENGLVVCEVQGYCKIQNAQNAGDVQFRPLTAMLIAIA